MESKLLQILVLPVNEHWALGEILVGAKRIVCS